MRCRSGETQSLGTEGREGHEEFETCESFSRVQQSAPAAPLAGDTSDATNRRTTPILSLRYLCYLLFEIRIPDCLLFHVRMERARQASKSETPGKSNRSSSPAVGEVASLSNGALPIGEKLKEAEAGSKTPTDSQGFRDSDALKLVEREARHPPTHRDSGKQDTHRLTGIQGSKTPTDSQGFREARHPPTPTDSQGFRDSDTHKLVERIQTPNDSDDSDAHKLVGRIQTPNAGDSDAHKLVECAVYQRIDPRSREAVRNAADRDGRRGCAIT